MNERARDTLLRLTIVADDSGSVGHVMPMKPDLHKLI